MANTVICILFQVSHVQDHLDKDHCTFSEEIVDAIKVKQLMWYMCVFRSLIHLMGVTRVKETNHAHNSSTQLRYVSTKEIELVLTCLLDFLLAQTSILLAHILSLKSKYLQQTIYLAKPKFDLPGHQYTL